MRYAVISKGLTLSQMESEVRRCGGRNLKIATASKQVFCELDDTALTRLRVIGCIVSKVGGIKATVISPPTPVAAVPIYSAAEILAIVGFEEIRQLFTPPIYGEGFNMAIIDSGIHETHELIAGSVIYSKNYTSDPMKDGLDHGTGVCSLVLAIVPQCGILNLKVLDDEGMGTEEGVALAIDDCIGLQDTQPDIAPTVINLSLGSPDDGNPNNPLRVACRAAIEKGIWVAASCGNGGPNVRSITSPACEHDVFAVGSAKYFEDDGAYSVSVWSSRGPTVENLIKPDAVMFGEDIEMASSSSNTATVAKSGTSFSTPIISGFGLLFLQAMSLIPFITHRFPGVVPGVLELMPVGELIDEHLPTICLRAEEAKNNEVGWGMPIGSLVAQAIGVRPAIDISSIIAFVSPLLVLGMLGMMVRVIK